MDGKPARGIIFLSFIVLAGCFGGKSVPPLLDDGAQTPISSASVASYLHDLSEALPGITVPDSILVHAQIPMVDGILIDSWVVRPPVEGRVPVILEVTPYYGGGQPVFADLDFQVMGRVAEEMVPRGYAYGIVSVRGTGNSGGCFTQGGPSEAKDTAAVVEHFARQDWSNGNVGLIGVSYPGTTPQDVWVEAPPALKTIVPISGMSDLYKYNFVNGVPINIQGFGFNTYYWAMVGLSPAGLSLGTQVLDPASVPGAVAGEACTDQVSVQEGGVSSTLDGNKDAYWQVRDFGAELEAAGEKPRASVFYIHGLEDWNVKPHMMEDWLPAVQDSGAEVKVWLGQWGHNWPQRDDWWNQTMVAWFDYWLKGVDTGIMDAPRVQVQADDGRWRHEDAWPPPDAEALVFYPDADGRLSESPGTGQAQYHDYRGFLVDDPRLQTNGADRVLFRSEPLDRDLDLAGVASFEANVTASGARASLILTLAAENATGLHPINYAAMSLNHVKSLSSGDSDISGERQFVGVRFFPQDDVVEKGSRLVLVAAANAIDDGPSLQPISDGSDITIELEGARLILAVDSEKVFEDPQPKEPT